ncbi:MAG: PilW family protein, partial [Geothrix sp.]
MRQPGTSGFSLVELLVALVFTMVLMAGMANVYKASLSAFYTSGESISSTRRNRMSVDLLVEDLNQAGMFLTDLASAPPVTEAMPVFLILPNMPVTGHGDNDPLATDELYFYQDQPLPFEGTLASGGTQLSAIELVARGTAVATADTSYTLDCGSAAYASQVAIGQVLVFKDAWQALTITSATPSG